MSERNDMSREETAATWFAARRRGLMSLDERRGMESWLAEAANADALSELERTWNWLACAQGEFADAKTSLYASARARPNRALVAAMCALCLGIGILSYSGDNQFWTTLDWSAR